MSQNSRIEDILKREGKIDRDYCHDHKLTYRLAARINDLKKKGWDFRTEELRNKNTVYYVTKYPTPTLFIGMKTLRFKKNIYTINIPFFLTKSSPWQEQVRVELEKLQARYKVRKSAHWGFSITEYGAVITISK